MARSSGSDWPSMRSILTIRFPNLEDSLHRFAGLVLVITLLIAACGGGSEDTTGTTDSPDATPTTTTSVAPSTTTTTTVVTTTSLAQTTTTTVSAGIVPGEDPDVDAIVEAYTIAYDSVSDYEAKAPYIEDPGGLEDTVAQYLTTGEGMGGIAVEVSAVEIDGESAVVTFDLLFNDNPTYPDLTGRAVLTEAGWQIPRSAFCSMMSSARVGCPDS